MNKRVKRTIGFILIVVIVISGLIWLANDKYESNYFSILNKRDYEKCISKQYLVRADIILKNDGIEDIKGGSRYETQLNLYKYLKNNYGAELVDLKEPIDDHPECKDYGFGLSIYRENKKEGSANAGVVFDEAIKELGKDKSLINSSMTIISDSVQNIDVNYCFKSYDYSAELFNFLEEYPILKKLSDSKGGMIAIHMHGQLESVDIDFENKKVVFDQAEGYNFNVSSYFDVKNLKKKIAQKNNQIDNNLKVSVSCWNPLPI